MILKILNVLWSGLRRMCPTIRSGIIHCFSLVRGIIALLIFFREIKFKKAAIDSKESQGNLKWPGEGSI